jgi:hypothetical protein
VARQQWLDMHSYPEDYERFLADGSARAEMIHQQDLLLGTTPAS